MSAAFVRNRQQLVAKLGGKRYDVEIEEENGLFRVYFGEECVTVRRRSSPDGGRMSLLIDDRPHEIEVEPVRDGFSVNVGGAAHAVEIRDPLTAMAEKAVRESSGPDIETVVAPMPGLVISVEVGVGDRVKPATPLVVVEAMKMQNELAARHGGLVRQVNVKPGQKVDTNEALVVLERAP
jgi:propionyl-CoA carboxylase alpha chain